MLRRIFTWLAILVVVALAGIVVYIGWFFSNSILVPQPYGLMEEFKIIDATDSTVTLPVPANRHQFADTRKVGTYNLLWESGYGRLGNILEEQKDYLIREFELLSASLPAAGAAAHMDNFIYRGLDPLSSHGLAYEDLKLSGQAGPLHVWWLTQPGQRAVLMLHGRRRADLSETLRVMPVLVKLGYPVLALAYRNHDQSVMSPDGFYHYGQSEWQDVITALEFLESKGIKEVAIFSYSMGSSVALETLRHLQQNPGLTDVKVVALMMDSPFLNAKEVIRQGARDRGLPLANVVADWALWIAGQRAGVKWSELNHLPLAKQLSIPALLIQCSQDQTIPVALSEQFVRDYQGDIQYQRLEGCDHTEAWNKDPQTYEGWVESFLGRHVPVQ